MHSNSTEITVFNKMPQFYFTLLVFTGNPFIVPFAFWLAEYHVLDDRQKCDDNSGFELPAWFLADRTNDRAYATMLRLSVVCHRIVADYEKSIDTKMNDFNLCLEVVLRSRQPLRHIRHWISGKPLESLVPKDHQ